MATWLARCRSRLRRSAVRSRTPVEPPEAGRGLRRTFRALGTPNYRLFFVGQTISATGNWMQRVAQDWLILELGGGPFELSIGVALQHVPIMLFALWGGLLIDRIDVRKALLVSQIYLGCSALALGLLTVSGHVAIVVVYIFAFGVGCASVIDNPARHAFVLDMVGPDRAANAISLNSSVNNAARLIGPAFAGAVIAVAGSGAAFLVNALTFVAIIVALLMMDAGRLYPRPPLQRQSGQVREGVRYAVAHPAIRVPLVGVLLISTFSQNFRVTLPPFAADVFGMGPSGYGLLLSALAVGALAGALACAHAARTSLRFVAMAAVWLGLTLLASAAAPTYGVLALVMVGVGAGNTSFNATSNTHVLLGSAPHMRGRVLALRTLAANGASPAGTIFIGWICEMSGPRAGLAVGGMVALLAAGYVLRASRGVAGQVRPQAHDRSRDEEVEPWTLSEPR